MEKNETWADLEPRPGLDKFVESAMMAIGLPLRLNKRLF
jgi:hypothetical protein